MTKFDQRGDLRAVIFAVKNNEACSKSQARIVY